MHNWIQMYIQERSKAFDYQGFIKPRRRQVGLGAFSSASQFVNVQFTWNGHLKPESSSFIGTSPEFELCLYSLLFFLETETVVAQLGPYKVQLKVFNYFGRGGKRYIGSAYPEAPQLDEHEAADKVKGLFKSRSSRT